MGLCEGLQVPRLPSLSPTNGAQHSTILSSVPHSTDNLDILLVVQNKPFISKVVLVAAPGLSADLYATSKVRPLTIHADMFRPVELLQRAQINFNCASAGAAAEHCRFAHGACDSSREKCHGSAR